MSTWTNSPQKTVYLETQSLSLQVEDNLEIIDAWATLYWELVLCFSIVQSYPLALNKDNDMLVQELVCRV